MSSFLRPLGLGFLGKRLVSLDSAGRLPAVDGSQLTGISSGAVAAYRTTSTSNTALTTAALGGTAFATGVAVTLAAGDTVVMMITQIRVTELNTSAAAAAFGLYDGTNPHWQDIDINAAVDYGPIWIVAQNQYEEAHGCYISGGGGVAAPMIFTWDVTGDSFPTGAVTLTPYAGDQANAASGPSTGELQVTGATTTAIVDILVITP